MTACKAFAFAGEVCVRKGNACVVKVKFSVIIMMTITMAVRPPCAHTSHWQVQSYVVRGGKVMARESNKLTHDQPWP